MNKKAKEELVKYCQLRDEVNELSEKLTASHKDQMACKKQCSECCMNFQVLPVEYFAILEELKQNSPSQTWELDEDSEKCNFLCDDLCQIYASRRFICYTHGLPLFYMNQEGDTWEFQPAR